MVICYILASDNAATLPCKHHENGSENKIKFAFLPEASPCKRSPNSPSLTSPSPSLNSPSLKSTSPKSTSPKSPSLMVSYNTGT